MTDASVEGFYERLEPPSRHYRLAKSMLADVEAFAEYWGFTVRRDDWPFHIMLNFELCRGNVWSVHCSGFNKRLDVQRLKKDGSADKRCKERAFSGAKSLVNFLNRRKPRYIQRLEAN